MREKIYPKKSLGQNFLKDENIILKIIEASEIKKEDTVIEIGPGKGALTKYLYEKTENLILIEKDKYLAQELEKIYCNATVFNMDFLKFSPVDNSNGNIKAIGNLPYNVSTQIIFSVLKNHKKYRSAVFMVQREVAQRITSPCHSKNYSLISVICQCFSNVKKLFNVSPECFHPKPSVVSTVVKFEITDENNIDDFDDFFLFVKALFYGKRKKSINCFKNNPFLKFNEEFIKIFLKNFNKNTRISDLNLEDIRKLYSIFLTCGKRG
jgi:16S rRNA (adenine1518-N6/adenine1519-N6)-dimethyltransferase